MKVGSMGNSPYYDRGGGTRGASVYLPARAPAGLTTIASITMTAKQAGLLIYVYMRMKRITVAGVAGQYQMFLQTPGLAGGIILSSQDNLVGAQQQIVLPLMQSLPDSQVVNINVIDTSTGGTIDFEAAITAETWLTN